MLETDPESVARMLLAEVELAPIPGMVLMFCTATLPVPSVTRGVTLTAAKFVDHVRPQRGRESVADHHGVVVEKSALRARQRSRVIVVGLRVSVAGITHVGAMGLVEVMVDAQRGGVSVALDRRAPLVPG